MKYGTMKVFRVDDGGVHWYIADDEGLVIELHTKTCIRWGMNDDEIKECLEAIDVSLEPSDTKLMFTEGDIQITLRAAEWVVVRKHEPQLLMTSEG